MSSHTAEAREIIRLRNAPAADNAPPPDDSDAPEWEAATTDYGFRTRPQVVGVDSVDSVSGAFIRGGAVATENDGIVRKRPLVLKRLLEGDPPEPPTLHTEKFLLAADVNFLAGSGDAGKSVTLFTVGVCTVLGRPLFGTLAVKQPGAVVFVVPEDGEAVARHHVDAVIAGLELTQRISDDERAVLVRDIHIIGDDRPFNLLIDTAPLAALIEPIHPTLVIADPLVSLIGGADENDERVAEAACANLRRDIARPLGAAILLAGHLRKPSREAGVSTTATVHDLKGSAGWSNHARIVWMVSKPKGENLITFRLAKSNRLPTGIEHQVTLAIEADPANAAHWLSLRLTDANIGSSSQSLTPGIGRAINDNERKVLAALDDRHEPGLRLSYSAWYKRSDLTAESTFKIIRERLIEARLVSAIATGRKTRAGATEYSYEITADGRQTLITGWNHA